MGCGPWTERIMTPPATALPVELLPAFLGVIAEQIPLHNAGLRIIAVSSTQRNAKLPDVPTFAEQGLQIQDIPAWSGIFAPGKMSPEVLQSLYETIARAAQTPAFRNYSRDLGGEVEAMPPAPFKTYVTSEIERYRRVLPPLGIELN